MAEKSSATLTVDDVIDILASDIRIDNEKVKIASADTLHHLGVDSLDCHSIALGIEKKVHIAIDGGEIAALFEMPLTEFTTRINQLVSQA